mmetsp:Transcript_14768/g.21094  ORF Transcript_14768/g.21094 Transcript_14768/m.21094 type:complete len:366 (-) Transcript_14768:378-1475(-)
MTIQNLTSKPTTKNPSVILFWATWHESSAPGGTADILFQTLSKATTTGTIDFYRVEAESCPELSSSYSVSVVPTFILQDASGSIVEKIEGMDDVARLTRSVSALRDKDSSSSGDSSRSSSEKLPSAQSQPPQLSSKPISEEEKLNHRLGTLIKSARVMIFMKGIPSAPRCGFSRQAVALLEDANITFGSFDILTDEAVRQGLKKYSDWPTYPQLYVNGEFVGGLDILKEMSEEGGEDLREQLGLSPEESLSPPSSSKIESTPEISLDLRLQQLVKRHKIMLFMKGLPSRPQCGFSRQIVDILDSKQNVSYDAFDILQDNDVRQGLKKFSDWPTYPQLYVDGEFIGGLDIVKELEESGELSDLLSS